ncbi:Shedu immune nuclease family protein [Mixta calida]|uniref:Shedu immune nuclease family protein n=1 Tax=Mixta calida TaxID=665913 RepID=UPI0034D4B06B
MARLLPEDFSPESLDIDIKEVSADCTEVFYAPSLEELNYVGIETESAEPYRKRIAIFNAQDDSITLFPIITLPGHPRYFQPKYDQIIELVFETWIVDAPTTKDGVITCLENLPAGWVRDIRYGLGFTKDYRFIISAIENLTQHKKIIIGTGTTGNSSSDHFYLNIDDFHAMRRNCDRITRRSRQVAQKTKNIIMYNYIADKLGCKTKPLPVTNDAISKMLNLKISTTDKQAALHLVAGDKSVVEQTDSVTLTKLKNDIELVSLERLIENYESLLQKNAKEDSWQGLFNTNPFILSLTFGFPAIIIADQASVGGKKLSGNGEKIADYIFKNGATNNLAIIEIKKPSTILLNKMPYRESVFSASTELSGSTTQILDQCYRLQQNIAMIKNNNRIYDIESYAIHCILVIGMLPSEEDEKKSFEIYRHNSRNVLIITFDELLLKLKQLHIFLSNN